MKYAFIILYLSCYCSGKSQEISGDMIGGSMGQRLDSICERSAIRYEFTGTVLVTKQDTVLLAKGYGWKNASLKEKNTIATVFQIGSLTKPFTAEIILALVEQGRLSLEDRLNKFIPSFPRGDVITIKQLLTHTSGIASYDIDEHDTIAYKPLSKDTMLQMIKNRPLLFSPGDAYAYSNSGYFLLGLIVEKVTGNSYEKTMRQRIFDPLGMTHSGFDFVHLPASITATGYKVYKQADQRPALTVDSSVSYAAGGMYSTITDLHKWALSVKRHQLLSTRTWTQSFTPVKENYGLGWIIDSAGGERFVGHGGGTPGFSSMLALFLEKDVMVIILGNFFDDNAGIDFLFQRITSALLEEETSNAGELEKFTGRYMLSGNSQRVIAIELTSGNLVAHLPDNSVVPVLLEPTMQFRLKGVRNAVGKFIVEHGKVVRMVIEQKGTYTWNRID